MCLTVDACDAFHMLMRFWEQVWVRQHKMTIRAAGTEAFPAERTGLLSSVAVIAVTGHAAASSWKGPDLASSCMGSWLAEVE